MAVYELDSDEQIVAMMQYHGMLIVATNKRLFEMYEEHEGTATTLMVGPVIIERGAEYDSKEGA